jgi:hypothetical protein
MSEIEQNKVLNSTVRRNIAVYEQPLIAGEAQLFFLVGMFVDVFGEIPGMPHLAAAAKVPSGYYRIRDIIAMLLELEKRAHRVCSCKPKGESQTCFMYKYKLLLARPVFSIIQEILNLTSADTDLHMWCLKLAATIWKLREFAELCKSKVPVVGDKSTETSAIDIKQICAEYISQYLKTESVIPDSAVDLFFAFAVNNISILTEMEVPSASKFTFSQNIESVGMLCILLDALSCADIKMKQTGFAVLNLLLISNPDNARMAANSHDWNEKYIKLLVHNFKFSHERRSTRTISWSSKLSTITSQDTSETKDEHFLEEIHRNFVRDHYDGDESTVHSRTSIDRGSQMSLGAIQEREKRIAASPSIYITVDEEGTVDQQIFEQTKEIFTLQVSALSITTLNAMQNFEDGKKFDEYIRTIMSTIRAQGANVNDMESIARVLFFSTLKRFNSLSMNILGNPDELVWKNLRILLIILLDFIFHVSTGQLMIFFDREFRVPDIVLIIRVIKLLEYRIVTGFFEKEQSENNKLSEGTMAHIFTTFQLLKQFLETVAENTKDPFDTQGRVIASLSKHMGYYMKFMNHTEALTAIEKPSSSLVRAKTKLKLRLSRKLSGVKDDNYIGHEQESMQEYLFSFADKVGGRLIAKEQKPLVSPSDLKRPDDDSIKSEQPSPMFNSGQYLRSSTGSIGNGNDIFPRSRSVSVSGRRRRKESVDSSHFAKSILSVAIEKEENL